MIAARERVERVGFRLLYRLADLTYAIGIATPKRSVAGTYWSYEPTNPHGDDPGLAALDALPDDATVVDAGAHVGEHAIPLALGTERRVIAVEPNGESADRLVRNARRNGLPVSDGDTERGLDGNTAERSASDGAGAIDLRRAGLGDATATLSFHRSTFSKLSAFDRDRATRWGAEVAGTEVTPIRRLDDLVRGIGGGRGVAGAKDSAGGDRDAATTADRACAVPPPDAIKIDVEGREGAVLRGAERTIGAYRPLLVVEVHDGGPEGADARREALRAWLTERGYAIEPAGDVWICRG
ncbi:FkbM family methyltransferase [Halorubrum kocurii]|uniref:SAM-dependent methyltransferase n=1 Tax=Halorubrum kocurii JCM 14978 TaxID=1230456 RepID=M0PEB7_9EURY|nr:FkbM family methyltransferase [Halorubrum kocurii]EMA67170.1 SAM-dependent methyltransferase [Halorubrum kocurii JCM 14978]